MSSVNSSWKLWAGLLALLAAVGVVSWMAVQYFGTPPPNEKAPDRIGRNAPFITSPDVVVDTMVEMAELTEDDLVYDLGCGDGRIVITAALRSGCRGVGFDIDPERVAEARENVRKNGVEHLVEIREQDVFTVDLNEPTAVLFYLLPWMNKKLLPKYEQLPAGRRLVSHDFGLGDIVDVRPDQTKLVEVEGEKHYVHRWNTPLRRPAKKKQGTP
jgi:SAM-dependent methyltransferase